MLVINGRVIGIEGRLEVERLPLDRVDFLPVPVKTEDVDAIPQLATARREADLELKMRVIRWRDHCLIVLATECD